MRILHVLTDVSRHKHLPKGGAFDAVSGWIKYTAGENIQYGFLRTSLEVDSLTELDKDVSLIPHSKTYLKKLFGNPLSLRKLTAGYDAVHYHHLSLSKIAIPVKLFRPRMKVFGSVYTTPVLNYTFHLRFTDRFSAASERLRNKMGEAGFPIRKVKTLYPVPDFDEYKPTEDIETHKRFKLWYSPGHAKRMGLYYLIDEWEALMAETGGGPFELYISIADLPETKKVIPEIEKRLSNPAFAIGDRTHLTGYFDDVVSFMRGMDCLIYPILDNTEKMSTPLMMLDAMLLEKLIIAAPTGGIGEILDGNNGIIFNTGKGELKKLLAGIAVKGIDKTTPLRKNARIAIIKKFADFGEYRRFYTDAL